MDVPLNGGCCNPLYDDADAYSGSGGSSSEGIGTSSTQHNDDVASPRTNDDDSLIRRECFTIDEEEYQSTSNSFRAMSISQRKSA